MVIFFYMDEAKWNYKMKMKYFVKNKLKYNIILIFISIYKLISNIIKKKTSNEFGKALQ